MHSHETLLTLIAALYDAPACRERWQAFLDLLCRTLDGTAASFISHDRLAHTGSVMVTSRVDPGATREYLAHWIHVDPWAHDPKSRGLSAGSVMVGDQIITRSALKRTGFYQDFSRRYDIAQSIVCVIESGPSALSGFSVNGSDTRQTFGGADVALLDALMPHLRRALQLHRRIAVSEALSADLAEALDASPRGTFLVGATGKVIWMNRAAERLTARRDGLHLDGGELRAGRADETTRLRTLLADARATSQGFGTGAGGSLFIGRASNGRPLIVNVAPLGRQVAVLADDDRPVALVMVSDPDATEVPEEHTLRDLLGLTPSEASLVRLLAQGLTLTETADRLGLRPGTVRTRVKTVFEKTGTHRQADLIRLALSTRPHP